MSGRPRLSLALLRHGGRDFRLMWVGQGLSLLGSQLTMIALPLAVLRFTGSVADAGLVATVRLLVMTAARLPAGAVADRWSRRTLMLTADGGRAVIMTLLGFLVLTGDVRLPLLLPLAAADGIGTALFSPAQAAAIRHLAGPGELASVLGLNQARGYAAALAGAPLGGLLFAVAAPVPFFADAASYLVSFGCLAAIATPLGERRHPAAESLWHDTTAGLRFIVRHRFVLTVMIWAALTNFATAGITFGLVVVVGGPEHGATVGAAYAAAACGGIAGALAVPRVMTLRPDLLVAGASAATVVACLVIAVVPAASVGAAAVAGMCILGPLIAVPLETRLYALVPDQWTGRVQGGFFLIGGSLYPLGSLVMGVLLAHGSARLGYGIFAGVLAAVLVLTVTPAFRHQLTAFGQAGPPTLATPPAKTAAPSPNSLEERHVHPASPQHAH